MEKVAIFLFFVLGVCFTATDAAPTKELEQLSTEKLRGIMATIPQPERNNFIRDNIDLGYKIQKLHEVSPSKDDEELAVEIFNYFVDNQEAIRQRKEGSKDYEDAVVLHETICYPDPIGCIDTDDPGIHPVL